MMLPAEKPQQESLRRAWRCPCAHLVLLNAMLPLGSVFPRLLGTLSCLSTDKKTKMVRSISHVVGALSQLLILLSEIHSLKLLVLTRSVARKLVFLWQMAGNLAHALFQVLPAISLDIKHKIPLQKPGNSTSLTADERCWGEYLASYCRDAFKKILSLSQNINFLWQTSENHFPVFNMQVRSMAAWTAMPLSFWRHDFHGLCSASQLISLRMLSIQLYACFHLRWNLCKAPLSSEFTVWLCVISQIIRIIESQNS